INSLATLVPTTFTGSSTLTIFSGVITNFFDLTFNGPTLDFGGNTGYFHLGFPVNIKGTSNITGSGGVVVGSVNSRPNYTLTLSNASNSFTGGLTINGNATVAFTTGDAQLGAAGEKIVFGGGTLQYTGSSSITLNRPITVGPAGGTLNSGAGTITL